MSSYFCSKADRAWRSNRLDLFQAQSIPMRRQAYNQRQVGMLIWANPSCVKTWSLTEKLLSSPSLLRPSRMGRNVHSLGTLERLDMGTACTNATWRMRRVTTMKEARWAPALAKSRCSRPYFSATRATQLSHLTLTSIQLQSSRELKRGIWW